MSDFYKLRPFLAEYKKQLIIGPLFKLIEAVFELIIPVIMARLIDKGINGNDMNYILKMSGLMLLLAALGLGSAIICQYSASIASQGFGTKVRNALFRHVGSFSYRELDHFGVSTLTNRITNDVNQLQFAVAMLIRLVIRAPFLCIGGLIAAILIDAKLAVILAIAIPLFTLVLYLIMKQTVKLYKQVQKRLDRVALIVNENLGGVRVIRAFDKVDGENQRFEDAAGMHKAANIKVGWFNALTTPATTLIMNIAVIAILWFGGMRVEDGAMTQGQIVAFISYMNQILQALIVVAMLVTTFTRAFASAGRVVEIFETKPDIPETGRKDGLKLKNAHIEFKEVGFSYEGTAAKKSEEYALQGLNFTVNPGETVGIIGLTGSGKSTLINLLSRFYNPTQGQILINGVDIKDISPRYLRSYIGLVPQKAVLFTGTIESNLKMGDIAVTEQDINRALKIAQAQEFVQTLAEGIKAKVVRGGANFSGGQKQRLTIARALVKRPSVLILDDASSALDFATESRLRNALKTETNHMTVLTISQRVSSVAHADKIIVLDDGKPVGVGTHHELRKDCPIYLEICKSQEDVKEVPAS